jgi:hypothetical protein
VAVEEARWPAKLQAKPKQEALGPFRRCLGLPSLRKAKKDASQLQLLRYIDAS